MHRTDDCSSHPQHLVGSSEDRKRRHQVELLTDAGLACWESKSMVRATNHGYEFLNAVRQGTKYRTMFMDLIKNGKTIADAVNTVITTVTHLP